MHPNGLNKSIYVFTTFLLTTKPKSGLEIAFLKSRLEYIFFFWNNNKIASINGLRMKADNQYFIVFKNC